MTGKLYAEELLKKITNKEELKILQVVWDDSLPIDKKIGILLTEAEANCSNSK